MMNTVNCSYYCSSFTRDILHIPPDMQEKVGLTLHLYHAEE